MMSFKYIGQILMYFPIIIACIINESTSAPYSYRDPLTLLFERDIYEVFYFNMV